MMIANSFFNGNRFLFLRAFSGILLLSFSLVLRAQQIAVPGDPAVNEKENYAVLSDWLKWNEPGAILMNELRKKADSLFARRDKQVADIRSADAWKQRQEYVRGELQKIFRGTDVRTPLNARITGTVKQPGYHIQKIIFESAPGYFVTGSVYVPEKKNKKYPAVLHLMGHDQEAFRAPLYQLINANLALKGVLVITIDPPGQGEMVQYYDSAAHFSSVGYSVIEHSYAGNQCFLTGISPAVHFVRDARRAIDYLVSRKDVDAARIGVTGFSGGGTITSYVSAVDDRVLVSMPCSWATASRRQNESKGTQDSETVLIEALPAGISFEDLMEVRAPKPLLLNFDSRDQYLSVQGAREAFAEIKKIYDAYAKPEQARLVEDNSKHWLTPKIRQAMYTFFLKHFDMPADSTEIKTEFLSKEQLWSTASGQLSTNGPNRFIFDINRSYADSLSALRKEARKKPEHIHEVKESAIRLTGYEVLTSLKDVFFNGAYAKEKYTVYKYAVQGSGDHPVPFLLYIPHGAPGKKAIIYLHPAGKYSAEARADVESLTDRGFIVAATDVIGTGETVNTVRRALTAGYTATLAGISVVGMQAGDILCVWKFLQQEKKLDADQIAIVGNGQLCIPLLHAAVIEKDIRKMLLIDAPLSYDQLVKNRIYRINNDTTENPHGDPDEIDFSFGVPGVLTAYDVPDLAAASTAMILVKTPRDHLFRETDEKVFMREWSYPLSVKKNIEQVTGQIEKLCGRLFP